MRYGERGTSNSTNRHNAGKLRAMASGQNIYIDSRDFRKALKAVGDDMEDLKATHKDAAEIVARRAAVISPQREGLLRDSVDSKATTSRGYVRAGGARTGVVYAGVIHFGHPRRNIRPQPFLYDALDQRRDEVLDEYKDRLDALIRQKGLK